MQEASRELAGFLVSTGFQDLPDAVVSKTVELVIDHFGVALFGATTPWAQKVTRLLASQGGKAECSVYAAGFKTTPQNAALANGTMGHAFELEDTLSTFHPGAVVIPAALAVAERERSSGKDLITAVVLGYEVMARVAAAVHDTAITRRGHHPTGVTGSLGAAAAAGKLLKLGGAELVPALGLASNMTTGTMQFAQEGAMEKRLFAGKASHDGVLSALLAAEGYTAAASSIDGEYGFCRAFDSQPDLPALTGDLGISFRITMTELKPYACCRLIHSPIDAAISLARGHDIKPEDISEVVLYGNQNAVSSQHCFYDVTGVQAAQYSIPYCLAAALVHRRIDTGSFSEAAFREPATLALMRRVRVEYDSEIDPAGQMAKLAVRLRNGESFAETVYKARGTPERPFSEVELTEKFYSLATATLPRPKADALLRLTRTLAEQEDITGLVQTLRG
ncbi:MAG: MmgE/PrpD family protein [Chloroflexi bacterium]|nr:MmgE/PrpD family protein [Chloroflexota bacterium]